jgi:hypothetical protein
MTGADRPAGGAVTGLQCGLHIRWIPGTGPDPFKGANKAAHLIVQETAGAHVEMDFRPGKSLHPLHPQFIQRLDRAGRLTDRGPERGEIMVADQIVGRFLHCVRVQVVAQLPDLSRVMGGGGAADQDAEQILSLDR